MCGSCVTYRVELITSGVSIFFSSDFRVVWDSAAFVIIFARDLRLILMESLSDVVLVCFDQLVKLRKTSNEIELQLLGPICQIHRYPHFVPDCLDYLGLSVEFLNSPAPP